MLYLSAGVGKPMDEKQALVYWKELGEFSAGAIQYAVRKALHENVYASIPQIGTIRPHCLEYERQQAQLNAAGGRAWQESLSGSAPGSVTQPAIRLARDGREAEAIAFVQEQKRLLADCWRVRRG